MIKFAPIFVVFFIICILATPTNSLAPDKTDTASIGNQSLLNQLHTFSREEDLFPTRGNEAVYLNNLDEDAMSNIGNFLTVDKQKISKQLEKFKEVNNLPVDPFDSMSIWREWYRLGD